MRSHILPRFIADKALDKVARFQFGQDARPKLAYNSWYDPELTTETGEIRLRNIDTAAAKIFRKLGLSWRHFPLTDQASRTSFGEFEIIKITDVDTKTLRMFLLSLLWRAAASTRFEFAEIFLETEALERLRRIVNGEIQPDDSDFPAVLVLLTTRGEHQIHGPLAQTLSMSEANKAAGTDLPDIPIFRFFLDGLVVHMGRRPHDNELLGGWSDRVVGQSDNLTLIGRSYEGSSQQVNLAHLQMELEATYPEEADRIYRALATSK